MTTDEVARMHGSTSPSVIAAASDWLVTSGRAAAFKPYDLRHTYASLLLSEGAFFVYVSQQLGHGKPITTVKHCARWMPSGNRRTPTCSIGAKRKLGTKNRDDRWTVSARIRSD
jgi:hypothetical protein